MGRCFLKGWQASSRSLSLTLSLQPCSWFTNHLFILFHGQFHKDWPQRATWGICSFEFVQTFGPEQVIARHRIVQGKSHKLACLPTDTDSLEVGVLPQQLLNHINYAAPNLLTSSLNTPRLRHMVCHPGSAHTGPTPHYKLFPHLGKGIQAG